MINIEFEPPKKKKGNDWINLLKWTLNATYIYPGQEQIVMCELDA